MTKVSNDTRRKFRIKQTNLAAKSNNSTLRKGVGEVAAGKINTSVSTSGVAKPAGRPVKTPTKRS